MHESMKYSNIHEPRIIIPIPILCHGDVIGGLAESQLQRKFWTRRWFVRKSTIYSDRYVFHLKEIHSVSSKLNKEAYFASNILFFFMSNKICCQWKGLVSKVRRVQDTSSSILLFYFFQALNTSTFSFFLSIVISLK